MNVSRRGFLASLLAAPIAAKLLPAPTSAWAIILEHEEGLPRCSVCQSPIYAGQPVLRQGGPHARCAARYRAIHHDRWVKGELYFSGTQWILPPAPRS